MWDKTWVFQWKREFTAVIVWDLPVPHNMGEKLPRWGKGAPKAVIPAGLAMFRSHNLLQHESCQFTSGPGTCDVTLHKELYEKRDDNWVASQTFPRNWGVENVEWISSEEILRRHDDKQKLRPAEPQKGGALGEETSGLTAGVMEVCVRGWPPSRPLLGFVRPGFPAPCSLCGGWWVNSSWVSVRPSYQLRFLLVAHESPPQSMVTKEPSA